MFHSEAQKLPSFYPFKGFHIDITRQAEFIQKCSFGYLTDSYGTFSVKNDFIYTQLSYIHTFNWQKAHIYLKKQEYSFASKKERRKKIVEMLNAW
ncbi:MAG: hypothetical protein FWF65_02455 [Bacteroidetes bacterium]|nr:hypothetical protein [Bacteroidota bacterium]